ncbi:MAG TPA: T9SS type A sorting domain-containing protein [Bacteroidia bacterium]|nr:T9SS type A sorting domain-containing protein [Bacteroidia bacterium]
MKTKIFFLWLFLLSVTQYVGAQSLAPIVLSPAGSYQSNGGHSLSQTVGEMTMVQTFSSGASILTQGMQQPQSGSVRVPEYPNAAYSMEVFPNPGRGNFYIDFKTPSAASVRIRVLDIIGQMVKREEVQNLTGDQRQALDLTGMRNGAYMVQVILTDASGSEMFRKTVQLQLIK